MDERVYDAAGRVVASRIGTDAWTCAPDDPRGRLLTKATSDLTVTAEALITERQIPLVGGVALTRRLLGADGWSYPNIHGDVMSTANAGGGQAGPHPHL